MVTLPIDDYKIWIRFRDRLIYDYIVTLTTPPETDDKIAELNFLNSLWSQTLLYNSNINKLQPDLNFLLFTHLLIVNSEFLSSNIYTEYDMEMQLGTIGYISTSTSDSSTSVGFTPSSAITNQSLSDGFYYTTKFGREYIMLIEQLQSFVVIL